MPRGIEGVERVDYMLWLGTPPSDVETGKEKGRRE